MTAAVLTFCEEVEASASLASLNGMWRWADVDVDPNNVLHRGAFRSRGDRTTLKANLKRVVVATVRVARGYEDRFAIVDGADSGDERRALYGLYKEDAGFDRSTAALVAARETAPVVNVLLAPTKSEPALVVMAVLEPAPVMVQASRLNHVVGELVDRHIRVELERRLQK